jgi:beta-glucosidase
MTMHPTDQAAAWLTALTLPEKALLLTGHDDWRTHAVERVGIPSAEVADGPHGLRRETGVDMVWYPATCLPTLSALASTWDREVLRRAGETLGTEAAASDVQVLLGPGINIKRHPLCGRNYEYLSEDPVVAGELATAYVQGVQSRGVGTSLKHFAANNAETSRFWASSDVDERTLREVYLTAFERVVRAADPWTIMCAYNRINGVHSSQHEWLLTEVLRDEWGYQGAVVSDWDAVHDRVAALRAGLDLEMPGKPGRTDLEVVRAVLAGEIPEALVDRSVERLLRLVARSLDAPAVTEDLTDAHHEVARELAERCIVVLRNETGVLPLAPSGAGTVAVIGEYATRPRLQGAGAAGVLPTRVDVPLTELSALLGEDRVRFALGYQDLEAVDRAGLDGRVLEAGDAAQDADPRTDDELRAEAVELAAASDTTVVVVGLPLREEEEARDRTSLDLPATQRRLLAELAGLDTRLVVVVMAGAPVALEDEWHDAADAVVWAGLLGQGGGRALARVLTGAAEPTGRLTETLPRRLEDTPAYLEFPGERAHVRYAEGVFVGHRWYDARDIAVRYPFGHGLSYTSVAWSAPQVEVLDPEAGEVSVTVSLTNTGDRPGTEVVQVYVGDPESAVRRPVRELKAFATVTLDAGETRTVRLDLTGRDFSWYDVGASAWRQEAGVFLVEVGASSADLRGTVEIKLPDGPGVAPLIDDDTLGGKPSNWRT